MLDCGDRSRFTLEALAETWGGRKVRRQDLDSDRAIQARVISLVDLAHAASPDEATIS
jgi:hypothetical protein